jgi:hypothetical protein
VARDGASVRDDRSTRLGVTAAGRLIVGLLGLAVVVGGFVALAGGRYLVSVLFWTFGLVVVALAKGDLAVEPTDRASGDRGPAPAVDRDDGSREATSDRGAGDPEGDAVNAAHSSPGDRSAETDDAPEADGDRFGSPFDGE